MARTGTPKKGDKQADFLNAYAETCSVSRASEISGVPRRTHYNWIASDEQYKASFTEIQEQAAQVLEDEAVRRAYEGIEKPITVAGKREVVREYSDTLLIFLLKGVRPEKFGTRLPIGPDGKPVTMHLVISSVLDNPAEVS